jgi:hypothetical protein
MSYKLYNKVDYDNYVVIYVYRFTKLPNIHKNITKDEIDQFDNDTGEHEVCVIIMINIIMKFLILRNLGWFIFIIQVL